MALFFPGKTVCLLCTKVIFTDNEAISFPAFIPKSHSLHKFSDGVFHKICFQNWEERERFERLYQKNQEIWESRPKNLKTLDEIETWGRQAFSEIFKEET